MKKDLLKDAIKIPNILSLFRIILIPFFIVSLHSSGENYTIPILILLFSFATDVLDGYIARKYNMTTELGKILDPGADKLTQFAILYAFYDSGILPLSIFIVFIVKEGIQVIGALYLKSKITKDMIPSNVFGKAATGLFYFSVILILTKIKIGFPLLYISVILMIIALATYAWAFYNEYNVKKESIKRDL